MRKSRNGQSGLFAAITKFTVLAMCFATVFALVLTAGLLDVDTSANVAEAEYSPAVSYLKVNGQTYSNDAEVTAAIQAALHAQGASSATVTIDLSKVRLYESSNMSANGKYWDWDSAPWYTAGYNGFGAECTEDNGDVNAWLNFRIPSVLTDFISLSAYTVTANHTADIYCRREGYSSGSTMWGYSFESGTGARNTFSWTGRGGATYNEGPGNGDDGHVHDANETITLSAGTTYLYVLVQGNHKGDVPGFYEAGGAGAFNNVFTFTIEYSTGENAPKDAAAPGIIEIDDTAGATTITSTLGDNLGTYLNQKSGLYGNIADNLPEDNVTLAGNTIKMTGVAVRKGALPADGNGVSGYSKKLTLNIADYTDTGAPANGEEAWYYSGLASVAASDESSVGVDTTSTGFSYGSPTEDGSENGLIVWNLAAPRDEATVTIYFKDNTPVEGVEFTIKDANDNAYSFNVVVDGIMEEASDISGVDITSTWETGEPLMGNSFDAVEWAYGAFEPIFTNPGNGKDALIWFFDVEYSAADPKAFGETAPTLSQGSVTIYHPFTYSVVGSSEVDGVYNFSGENAGKFFGYPTADGTAGATGTGYYRFTFYAMNYAGYITETGISRYVKADIENPTNDAVVTYEYDSAGEKPHAAGDTGNFGTIDFSERGAYVNEPLTVTITWRENLSGNRVQIIGADGMERHVFVKDGKITQIVDLSSGAVIISKPADNKCVLPTSNADTFESVKIKLTAEGENRTLAVTYTLKDGNDYAEAALFTVYSNADMDAGTTAYGSIYEQSVWSDSDTWGIEGVYVYIDRYAFEADEVDLTNEGEQIERNEELDEKGQLLIPAGEGRNWYTSAWEMLASLTVPTDDDRAKAYYITEYYKNDVDFNAGWERIKTAQQGWSFINNASQEGWSVYDTNQGGVAPITLEFGSDAGYYVTYVILVDGAMNKSDVAVFGVLVDANPYKLSAVYAEGYQDKLGAPYVIGFVGADGKPVTADTIFHRGDEVTFSATLGNAYTGAYVPYKLEKKDANGDIIDGPIYIHPYNNNSAAFTDDGVQNDYAYINIESDGTLKLDVDRNSVEKLPMLRAEGGGNYAQIVFSYRKLVDVKPTTDMTDYTGTEITPQFSVTDLTENKGSVTFGDGESPYRYTVLYPGDDFESILHAGTYTIKVTYSEKESEFYVLNAEDSYSYTVNKGSITMEVGFGEGPYTYGEVTAEGVMGLIEYNIKSGLVEADNAKSFTELFGASAKFSLPGGTEGTEYYIPAGSYEVNAVFTANDYDVTVTWKEGSNKLTIGKRGLTVTAAENSWTYGDIPAGIKVTVPDTLGFGADKIAALFGVDADKVSVDATSGWTVELPFAAVATGLQKNDGGYYNVGSYAVTGFTDALALDPNFTASIADGEGKIAITAAKVTVTPVTNAIRVTDAADLAGIVIAFVPTQDTEKFGVTGAFGVDTDSATGDAAYGLEVTAGFSSVHNDYVTADDAVNVEINYNIEGVTVNVTIGANGTFTITVDATTEYGTLWTIENNYKVEYTSHIDNDDVTAEDLKSLEADIAGYETDVLLNNVGYYQITFTPTLAEGLERNDYIFEYVDAEGNAVTGLTVIKKVVTVGDNAALTAPETLAKEYGAIDEELDYSITITEEGALNGKQIKVGGIYRANADGTARGGRYDDVGNYGIYAAEAVFSDADNFEIVLGDVTGTFVINPKVIDFYGDGVTLYGTDKVYGSAAPGASAPDARITLDNTVILNGDNVTLTYVAQYYEGTDNPVSTIGSGYMIGFGELKLGGTDAKNYTLGDVTIVYTDPVFAIIADPIVISLGHFTVGKTYDAGTGKGDTKVSIAAISELADDDFTLVSATYESADAGSVVVTVVLFFAGFTYPGEGELANYYNLGSGVSIAAATDGVNITISGIKGTIAQREITLDDIKFLFDEEGSTYRTKVYDGTASVDVPFDFEDTFKSHFAEGFDVKADAVLEFTADTVTSAGKAKNVGKGYLIDVTNVTLGSTNYKLADAIEADGYTAVEGKIGGTFAITERPIELGIEIEDKTYDQSSDAKGNAWFGAAAEGESVLIGAQTYEFVRNVNAGTADAASYEPFPYVQIGNLDSGHYWHDVRVTLTVTTSGNFDWSNYDLQGYDVEVKEGEIVIVLEKAAYLDPVTISLTTEKIKAEGKAYDGNTSATLDVSTAYETSAFLNGDADVVKLTYTAVFASPNAGTGIGITASGFKFVAKDSTDENAQFIADSYKTYTGTLTEHKGLKADITPRVLTATATLPGKTYDGTVYGGVDESKIVWKLEGFVGSDANNYSVEVLAAGYEGADVDADGNPNEGFVYGYHLVNNAQKGVMNYTIKAHDTKEYNEYSAKAGAEPFSAELNKIIVAEYTENGAVRYLIPVDLIPTATEDAPLTTEEQALVKEIEDKLTLPEEVSLNSFPASGKIDPAQLIFTVEIVTGHAAWEKNFDDTVNVYEATYGAPGAAEGTYAFKVTLSDPASGGQALVGITLEQDDFSVSFADANVGTGKDIIFTVNVVGEQSNNNNFIFNESNSYTVKGAGTIKRAAADMSVGYGTGDVNATYGDAGSALLDFNYKLGSYELLVDADGYAYILSTRWNAAFGRDNTSPSRPELPLPTDRLYIKNTDGTFALITEGETVSGDQYVRINGRFTDLNVLSADGNRLINDEGLISAKAGTYEGAKAYVVNVNFPTITPGATATVTVNKAELTVTTDKDAYDAVYWTGTMPTPVFTVASGNASFDDPAALAKAIKWAFKGTDGVAATVQSTPNSKGGSYTLTVEALDNYTVTIVNAEPALTITIPALDTTVYSAVASGTRPAELDTDGNAIALDETDLIRGVVTGVDEVVIVWSTTDGVVLPSAPANAGSYTWTATITRKIGGYHYDGEATLEGTFEITKRNVIVSLKEALSFVFEDGKTYTVSASDLVAVDAETGAAVENFVDVLGIGYSKDGVSVDGMTTAGAYNLVLTMGDEFEVNYALVDRVNAIRVTPKAVTVTVEDASKSHNVTTSDADYAGIVFDSAGFENLTVTYRDGSGKVIGSTPKTPGIYTYTISSTDPNYTVSGNTTGTIRIVVSEVSFVKDGVTYATVSFTNPVATNYVLSDTTVSPNGNYWNIIDQNVAALAGEDEVLSTSGIVRVALSAGGNHTSGLSEKVTVTARIPDGVAAGFDVYYVTASGKLAPLSELDPEFRIEGGNIVYTTDYVSNLIFVNSSAPGFNWWIIPLIAAALILILALAILIGVLVKLHRAPDPVPVEVAPIDSIMPEPPVVAPVAAAPAPVFEPAPAADIEPATYDAPAAVSKHGQPPIIGIR